MAGEAALDSSRNLAEIINSALYRNVAVSIGGRLIRRVEISRRRVVIEFASGRIAVEPFVHPEVRGCDPGRSDDLCYTESVSLVVTTDSWEDEEQWLG